MCSDDPLRDPLRDPSTTKAKGGVPMSDTSQGPDWWLASDGKWYPPQPQEIAPAEVVQSVQPSQAGPAPAGAVSPQGAGWWQATDGFWYPPTPQPREVAPQPREVPPAYVVPSVQPSPRAPAPAGGASPRGPAKMSPTTWVMLAGGALVIIGSFTTWVTASIGIFSVSENGISGDGRITLVLALLAIGAVLLELQITRPAFSIATLVLFGLLTILSVFEFVHISSKSYSSDGITISATVGFGVYLCLAGSIAGVAAWFIEKRTSGQVTT